MDYDVEEKEKNDYIELKNDMTYVSVDEGVLTTGKWSFNDDEDYFIMYDESFQGLKFFVEKLKSNKMVVELDLEEVEGVDIHYKN